jgi:hypothetical protein
MSACAEFECFICNICKEGRPTPAPDSDHKLQKTGKNENESVPWQWADALLVYVLGKIADVQDKQLDIYSGVNGYHIRTIPGKRWRQPIMVGAGASLVVVVDRFEDYDQLRFTDEYGGATTIGFDSDGYPLDSVQWDTLTDLYTYNIPIGYRVSGISITSWGMCIANIQGVDGKATFIMIDATGHCGLESVFKTHDQGLINFKDPYCNLGQILGPSCQLSHNPSEDMFWNLWLVSGVEDNAVMAVDSITGEVKGLQGLPTSPTPMSAVFSNNIISVLCGENGVGSVLYRFNVDPKHGANQFILRGAESTPGPTNQTITYAPSFRDDPKQESLPESKLPKYLEKAAKINESSKVEAVPSTFEDIPRYPDGKSSQTLNEDRVSATTTIAAPMYDNHSVDATKIDLPADLGVLQIVGAYGTIAELFDRGGDPTKPIFRLVHGTSYDFIVDGGFSYGCSTSSGEFQGVTNGLIGESIAVDKKYTLGTLRGLDVKAALIDSNTGNIIFREPKPQSTYRVYGGDYPALDPYISTIQPEIDAIQDDINRLTGEMLEAEYDGMVTYAADLQSEIIINQAWKSKLQARLTGTSDVLRSGCTNDTEAILEVVDGIERLETSPWLSPWLDPKRSTPGGSPIAAFGATPTTLDDFWTCFVRKPSSPKQVTLALMRRNWSRVYTEPGDITDTLLPEWVSNNVDPIQEIGNYQMFVSPRTPTMLTEYPIQFNYTSQGGFYPLGFPTSKYSNFDRYREEISSLNTFDEEYQRLITAEQAKPEAEQDTALITRYTAYIAENATRRAQLNIWLSGTKVEKDFYHISRRTLTATFPKIDISTGQTPDTETGIWSITDPITPVSASEAAANKWKTIAVGTDLTKKRGCVIEPGPYAWIAVAINLRADSMLGQELWLYPEARRNGLGIKVGALDYESMHPGYVSAFGIKGGGIYCAGWRASQYGEGAWAFWEWGVDFGGAAVDETSPAHIQLAAPSDAKETLLADIASNTGTMYDEYFAARRYYIARAPLSSVRVWFRMTHLAKDVFRVGYRTIFFDRISSNELLCPAMDPGYYAGHNCVEALCGNVTCPSQMFGLSGHLYRTDPTYSEVYTPIMEGQAIFTLPENPYADLGLAYGAVWKLNVTFNLNNNVRGFDIPLLPNSSRIAGQR